MKKTKPHIYKVGGIWKARKGSVERYVAVAGYVAANNAALFHAIKLNENESRSLR